MPFDHPFVIADVESRGLTYAAVRGWLERGECERLATGLYLPQHLAQAKELSTIWQSRDVAMGTTAVSAVGAAILHKLPLPRKPAQQCLQPIPLRLLPSECRVRRGRLVLPSLEWTCILLARGQTLSGALIPFDAAARLELDIEQLAELYSHTTRWPGVAAIGAAINEMDALSGSPLESAARGWMIERGLPNPLLQHPFTVAGSNYFVDFYWPEFRVIVEADGLQKYDDHQELRRERRRQSALDATGCRIIRIGWHDLEQQPQQLLRTLHGALH